MTPLRTNPHACAVAMSLDPGEVSQGCWAVGTTKDADDIDANLRRMNSVRIEPAERETA